MRPKPIETVVIHKVVRRRAWPTPPGSGPATPEPVDVVGTVQFSPDQQRDVSGLAEVMRFPVRQQILLALASGGETHVGGLADRTSIPQKTITHHLHDLRNARLVVSRRCGKQIFNALAARRFRFRRQGAECFALTLAAWGGNTRLKVEIGPEPDGSDAAPEDVVAPAAVEVPTDESGTIHE